ncbi:bacterio-opsin activator domain-containing protein [Natronosalvus vescus]|uniref:bacterio-opsin activator domain-containing protein n=1 Tax=Natronosalvus vescus TaxID=2953881 RepID=UPI0020905E32|nr:bacterio-opsin activator domain-containing protein [Natronosalvus vescus]
MSSPPGREKPLVLVMQPARATASIEQLTEHLTEYQVRVASARVETRRILGDYEDVVALCHSSEPSWVRSCLKTLAGEFPDRRIPTIVVPPSGSGSERLATITVRAGGDDYVSPTALEELPERIDSLWAGVGQTEPRETKPATDTLVDLLSTTFPDEVFVLGADGTYLDTEVRPDSADLYTVRPDEFVGRTLWDAFSDREADRFHDHIQHVLESREIAHVEYDVETTEGTRQYLGRVVPIGSSTYDQEAVLWLARDTTELESREAALQQRREQLELLNRVNAVVRRVIKTLVEAPTQSAVEEEACELLVASDLYCGSWISRPTGDGSVVYQTGCGDVSSYLEAIKAIDYDADDDRPIIHALQENTIHSSTELQSMPEMPPDLAEAAREHDIKSAIAVPLSHGDSVYGVLTVLARREDAFGSREEEAFRLLGETIGFAINAIKNRRLLFADAVTVLEFRIEGGNSFSFDLSTKYDCQCALEWSGTTANGRTYQYVTIDGVDGQTVYEEATAHETVEECRLVHDGENEATIEIRLAESAVRTLKGYGATIRDVTVDDGVGHITVEFSRETDTRAIVEALQRVYEEAELVAKREVDRPVTTASERRNRIADRLTERQLTALRLAYYGGYFDWPRGSTGEDIAESMGISPPTMHQHLRRGLEEILGDFFEVGPEPTSTK